MSKVAAINYLIPPQPYLWQWADDGSAAEWNGDATVCLWMELHALLNYLAPRGLPPVGSILMVLMACQQKAAMAFHDAMKLSAAGTGSAEPSSPSRRLLLRLKEVLERVQALPAELRTGLSARAHLLRTLFDDVPNRQPPDVSRRILEEVDIWGLEDLAREKPNFGAGPRLLRDLKALATVYECRDLPRLESLVRTGLEDVCVQPAHVPEPTAEPGESTLPLLRQLEEHREDAQLAALAGLARRMVAMFSLPRPSGHPQQLPVGGISDITNHGPLDRLLPSELANDDLTLTARLANNEALYYRRDTPPDEPATERLILMDTGIHLWGTPRVFSLAAVLGLQAGAAGGESVRIFRREGAAFRPLTLDSVAAVRDCLVSVHAAPDPEDALNAFRPDESTALRPDVFFVSVSWQREAVRRALHDLALRIADAGGRFYLLTVSRSGALELGARTAAGVRRLAAGRIDPDTIFRSAPPPDDKPVSTAKQRFFDLPEIIRHLGFYQQWPLPFRFVVAPKEWSRPLMLNGARVGVTDDRRLMRWDQTPPGAVELAAQLPAARDYHILRSADAWTVVASAKEPGGKVIAVMVQTASGQQSRRVLDSSHPYPTAVKVMHGAVILGYSHKAEACLLSDGRRVATLALTGGVSIASVGFDGRELHTMATVEMPPAPARTELPFRPPVAPVLAVPLAAGFDSAGSLIVRARGGSWELSLPQLLFKNTPKKMLSAVRPFAAAGHAAELDPPPVPGFYVAEWNSDCRLIFDTRGVLHIVFHDMHGLVEIAVLCLLEKPTAAWVRHWPERKQFLGDHAWFATDRMESQPPVHLTPLVQRFSGMARTASKTPPVTVVPANDLTFTRSTTSPLT